MLYIIEYFRILAELPSISSVNKDADDQEYIVLQKAFALLEGAALDFAN